MNKKLLRKGGLLPQWRDCRAASRQVAVAWGFDEGRTQLNIK
jgi:hypothetical protein